MGAVCTCEPSGQQFKLEDLVPHVEGVQNLVSSSPEIRVKVQEFDLHGRGSAVFNPRKFSWHRLSFVMLVEIKGTRAELRTLAPAAAADPSASKAAPKKWEPSPQPSASGGLLGSLFSAVAWRESHSFTARLTADLRKQAGSEEVAVVMDEVQLVKGTFEGVIADERARDMLKGVVADVVSKGVVKIAAEGCGELLTDTPATPTPPSARSSQKSPRKGLASLGAASSPSAVPAGAAGAAGQAAGKKDGAKKEGYLLGRESRREEQDEVRNGHGIFGSLDKI